MDAVDDRARDDVAVIRQYTGPGRSHQLEPRICFVIEWLPPRHSGASLAAFRLAQRIAARSPSRVLMIGGWPPRQSPEVTAPFSIFPVARNEPATDASLLVWTATDLLDATQGARGLWPLLYRLRDRYDVVHFFGAGIWFNLMSVPIARALRKPVIAEMTLVGADDPGTLRGDRNWKHRLHPRRWRYSLFRRADAVVGNSQALEDEYRRSGLPLVRFTQIPRAVDPQEFHPVSASTKAELRRTLGLPPRKLLLLFVGGMTRRKGLHHVLPALRTLIERGEVDPHLVAVAPTANADPAYSAHVGEEINRLDLTQHVTLLDYTERVSDYMKAVDIFVFPSSREGFPNAVAEAMATGLAVVASDIPEIAESQIDHGRTGLLFPPGDDEKLMEFLVEVSRDAALRARLGSAAREHALGSFSPERVDAAYEELYRRVTAVSPRPGSTAPHPRVPVQ